MNRQRKLTLFVTSILFAFIASSAMSEGRPSIILCMADDLGWGDTGYNGHPALKAPNLDRMAEQGIVFNRFYSAAPVCS
ncbi:MAG: sulfatase-like hydrolase/transferase, partial [Candidatus Omnitrophica bacterium]|nr:sulfatase-like hydrolase/transferase [Candidatus Omnitrophota bacterium]